MIVDYCLQFGDITLASGEKSNWYFNMKNLVTQTWPARLIAKLWYDELVERDIEPNLVGGPAVGALIPATGLAQHMFTSKLRSGGRWPDLFYFDRKDHGDQRQLHGLITAGDKVVLIEDVVTTGGSILACHDALQAKGACTVLALAIVDREAGGAANLLSRGINLYSIFTKGDFDEAIKNGLAKLQG
jgi:orotate phosphoribosyltransferase